MYNCIYNDGSYSTIAAEEYDTFGCPPENGAGAGLVEVDDLSQVATGDPPAVAVNVLSERRADAGAGLLVLCLVALFALGKGGRV